MTAPDAPVDIGREWRARVRANHVFPPNSMQLLRRDILLALLDRVDALEAVIGKAIDVAGADCHWRTLDVLRAAGVPSTWDSEEPLTRRKEPEAPIGEQMIERTAERHAELVRIGYAAGRPP